jgi:hypothetical protein
MKQIELPPGTWINKGDNYWGFNTAVAEEKKNAKYVGDFCLKTAHGTWAEQPVALFWQEKPPVEGYSNYFGLFMVGGDLYITGGQSAVDVIIDGVIANDGEIIYSRYRHDCRFSKDGSAMIDGGRDYTRTMVPSRPIKLAIIGPELVAVEE